MTKAVAVMVCGGEKKLFLRLLNFEEAVCPDGLFVPAVFRESDFYLNSLKYDLLNLVTLQKRFNHKNC